MTAFSFSASFEFTKKHAVTEEERKLNVWRPTPSVPVQDRNRLSGFFPEGIQPQKGVV